MPVFPSWSPNKPPKPKEIDINDIEYVITQGKPSLNMQKKSDEIVLMPCPFTGSNLFCAGPNFLFQIPDQKIIYILLQSQTFCAKLSVKLVFVPAQKVLKRH